MNLHTTYIENRTTVKRTRTGSRKKNLGSFAFVFKIIALLVVIFLIASARALMNSEREKLNRRAVKLKNEIHVFNREIANLQIRQEQYHGRYILRQIKKFNLKLQYPIAGQVRKIILPKPIHAKERDITELSEIRLTQR